MKLNVAYLVKKIMGSHKSWCLCVDFAKELFSFKIDWDWFNIVFWHFILNLKMWVTVSQQQQKTFKLKVFIFSFHNAWGMISTMSATTPTHFYCTEFGSHTQTHLWLFPGVLMRFCSPWNLTCWHKSWLGFFGNICHLHFACNHCIHYAPDFVQVGDVGMFWRVHSRVFLCLTKAN